VPPNLSPKSGLAVTWPTEAIAGVECLRATALRHHYGRHCHEAYAIGVIESGVGGNRCRGADHYTPAGSIVTMNPGEAHTGYTAGDRPLSYRMLYITAAAMRTALPEGAPLPHFSTPCIDDRVWADRLGRLHRCLEADADPMAQQDRFLAVIGSLCARFGSRFGGRNGGGLYSPPKGKEPLAVGRVKAYLRTHFAESVCIDDLARLTGLNRAYLIRTFTRTVGMPPYTYLTQIRVERAKERLAAGRTPADTALAVGFADQSHLNRHFKKLTGTTPRLYRLGHYRSRKSV
jgi:AraC-like DNA-binding protein